MSKAYRGKYKTFAVHGKEYLKSRYDLLRLELLEKTSSIVSLLILVMIALLLVGSIWIYLSCIAIVWLKEMLGNIIPAFVIMGGVNLLVLGLIIAFKNQLILNPLIRRFSAILFDREMVDKYDIDDEDEDEINENDKDDE